MGGGEYEISSAGSFRDRLTETWIKCQITGDFLQSNLGKETDEETNGIRLPMN